MNTSESGKTKKTLNKKAKKNLISNGQNVRNSCDVLCLFIQQEELSNCWGWPTVAYRQATAYRDLSKSNTRLREVSLSMDGSRPYPVQIAVLSGNPLVPKTSSIVEAFSYNAPTLYTPTCHIIHIIQPVR